MKKHLKNNIAFVYISHEYEKWHAGLVHFASQINLIKNFKNYNFLIFTDSKKNLKQNIDLNSLKIVETSIFKRNSFLFILRKLIIFFLKKDYLLFYLLKKYNVKILANRDLFKNKKIKSMCFIPDAGFLTLKNIFNKKELSVRRKLVEKLMKNSDLIYTHSYASKKSYKKYYKKVKIIPIRTFLNIHNSKPRFKKINVKNPVFYFPAQMWLHKNHILLVELAKKLKNKKIKCKFIFSGKKEDHRNPNNYKNILNKIKKDEVENYFNILGHIKKNEVVNIINECSALISPSKDEGWGFIKDEARYFGKYIFLSKIPGHEELNPPGTIFFNLNNINDLEKKIIKFIKSPPNIKKQIKLKENSSASFYALKKIALNDTEKAYKYLLSL